MTIRKVTATSTGLTAGAYVSGQTMGNRLTFTPAVDFNEGVGIIRAVNIFDASASLIGAFELHLFAGDVTFGTDKAVPTLSDADLNNFGLGFILFNAATDTSVLPNNLVINQSVNKIIKPAASNVAAGTNTADGLRITGHLLARSAPAGFLAATDIKIDLYIQSSVTMER